MSRALTDPWAIPTPPAPPPPPWRPLVSPALAVLLGAIGPALAVAPNGRAGARGAVVLASMAVVVEIALRGGVAARRLSLVALGAAAIAGAVVVAVPLVGRVPVPLTVLGVVVADAALCGWAWAPRGGRAAGPPAAVAVPFVVVAQVLWAREQSAPITIGLLVVAAVIANLHHRGVDPLVRAGDRLAAVLGRLATLVGLVAFGAVAIATVYLPGAAARVASALAHPRRRWDDDRSNWVARDPGPPDPGDESYAFGTTRQRVVVRRNLVGFALAAAVFSTVAIVTSVRPPVVPPGAVGSPATSGPGAQPGPAAAQLMAAIENLERVPWSERPAFAGAPFADDLQADTRAVPLLDGGPAGSRLGDVETRYVNIVDGARVSLAPTCDCPTATLVLAGGSAAFGLGQRDEHTIGSELVRLAGADGIALRVVNLGVPGWTLVQERAGLDEYLGRGGDPPDLVVFHDGYNDVIGTVVESATRTPDPGDASLLVPDQVGIFVERVASGGLTVDGPALGRIAAQRYHTQMEAIVEDLDARGIGSAFFFQGDALGDPVQIAPVDALYRDVGPFHRLADLPRALDTAAEALGPSVSDLGDLFVGLPRPVFLDSVHSNEEGARIAAGAIYAQIRDRLADRAR